MKTVFKGGLIGALMLMIFSFPAVQAEIKVGIAGPLSGSTLTSGEQQEIGA